MPNGLCGSLAKKAVSVCVLFLVIFGTPLTAEGKEKIKQKLVAVLEIACDSQRISYKEAQYLSDAVRKAASDALDPKDFMVMTRENMDIIIPPEERVCTNTMCYAKVAQRLTAEYLIGGNIRDFAGRFGLTLEAYDGKGVLLGSEQGEADTTFELLTLVRQLTPNLLAKVPGTKFAKQRKPPSAPEEQSEEDALKKLREEQKRREAERRAAERAERDPEYLRSWDGREPGVALVPLPGRLLTNSEGWKVLMPLAILGYGLSIHRSIVSIDFAIGSVTGGALKSPAENSWHFALICVPGEFDLTFRFGKGFPLGARIGVGGVVDLGFNVEGKLLAGFTAFHLVYDYGTRKDEVGFEVAGGFEYAGWKLIDQGASGGDPMGGGRVLMTVPLGMFSWGELRLVLGCGYYRGPKGAQDIQWLLHFRYYNF